MRWLSPLIQDGVPGGTARIAAIDGLRGLAVILVFAVHFVGGFSFIHLALDLDAVADVSTLPPAHATLYWLFYSHYGVYLFFCISGFVVTRSFRSVASFADWRAFMRRRLLRIYPAFLLALAAAVGIVFIVQGPAAIDLRTLLANLVFMNGFFALDLTGYNNVTWSLFFEFVFYIFFSLLYLLAQRTSRARQVAPVLWTLFVVALAVLGYVEWFLLLPFLLGALGGLTPDARLRSLAARLADPIVVVLYLFATSVGCLFVRLPTRGVGGLVWASDTPVYVAAISVVFMLLIVRAAYATGVLHRVFTHPLVVGFGRISYSFFLAHALVIDVVLLVTLPRVTATLGNGIALGLLAFSLSTVLAALMYRYVELPFQVRRPPQAGTVAGTPV